MRTLVTDRLMLRPFVQDDLLRTHQLLYADPEVAPAWTGRTKTIAEIETSFARKVTQPENGFGFLAIVSKVEQALIGTIALQRYELDDDTSYIVMECAPTYRVGGDPAVIEVELTYALGRAYWGNGFTTEAGRRVIDYGFNELGVRRIINDVSSTNTHSINVMRRLGFRLQRNLHPRPFLNSDAPGVIGLLERNEAQL